MNLIETNNNQMDLEFAGQMVERHDVQPPSLLEVRLGHTLTKGWTPYLVYFLYNLHKLTHNLNFRRPAAVTDKSGLLRR